VLVVAQVVVIGRASLVLVDNEIPLRIEGAAHGDGEAGALVSHPVSSLRIHCSRTGRPISFARKAASNPASSAAVRP
jgi:hypothetical protein